MIFVSLGLGEVALRFLGFGYILQYQYDPNLLWTMKPKQKAFAPSYGVGYYINAHGLRDDEFDVKKKPGEFRILGLGDSITFGQGVDFGVTFIQQLEHRLNALTVYDTVQVINSGVAGYNLFQELAYLKSRGLAYQPDLVVLGFCKNDVVSEADLMQLHQMAKEGLSFGIGSAWQKWKNRIAWLHLVDGVYTRVFPKVHDSSQNLLAYAPGPKDYLRWSDTQKQLIEIARVLAAKNIPLIVIVFPMQQEIAEKQTDDSLNHLLPIAGQVSFVVFDLYPAFVKHAAESLFLDPVHLSQQGHEIAARSIFELIIQNDFLPYH